MSEARWSASGLGDLRASDADRDKTAKVLRTAATEGRLDLAELEERLERTFAAERHLIGRLPLPIGLSLFAVAAR